jgi:hypothetical protein
VIFRPIPFYKSLLKFLNLPHQSGDSRLMLKISQPFLQLGFLSSVMTIAMATVMPAIATAPMPPKIVGAILNGKPIDVLYVTRSSDKVLIRCYPGQKPSLSVREQSDGTKEGTLTCGN